ncbi:MAG: thiol peroxidase [Nitrospira sp.]|nr:MAG: thiol peroxidase [Nitrospira sp.]
MSQNRTVAWTITFAIGLLASAGCAEMGHQQAGGFSYQPFPVATGSGTAGDGQSVTFKGKPLAMTGGPGIKVGDSLREVKLAKTDLSLVSLTETKGKVRIVSIVPSLDTKVCEQQTHYLSEKNAGLDQGIELITVSIDTPFAQSRFAKDAHIENVTFLSDYRGGDFGKTYGLLVKDVHILARTVMVVDKENVIRYLQITPELAQMPDMEAAFNAARGLR